MMRFGNLNLGNRFRHPESDTYYQKILPGRAICMCRECVCDHYHTRGFREDDEVEAAGAKRFFGYHAALIESNGRVFRASGEEIDPFVDILTGNSSGERHPDLSAFSVDDDPTWFKSCSTSVVFDGQIDPILLRKARRVCHGYKTAKRQSSTLWSPADIRSLLNLTVDVCRGQDRPFWSPAELGGIQTLDDAASFLDEYVLSRHTDVVLIGPIDGVRAEVRVFRAICGKRVIEFGVMYKALSFIEILSNSWVPGKWV